jgi:hypothetical protein
MKLFCSAQHRNPRHIYDETKNRKGGPKRKTKGKPSKTIAAGAVDD